MKQTNNALKFLLAQYRAIFKNAYFKGLTSALVITAGLAAAQGAQATITLPESASGDAFKIGAPDRIIIQNSLAQENSIADTDVFFSDAYDATVSGNLTFNGGSLSSISDAPTQTNKLGVLGTLTMNQADLIVNNNYVVHGSSGSSFTGFLVLNGNDDSGSSLKNGAIHMSDVTIKGGATITISGTVDNSNTTVAGDWNKYTSGITVGSGSKAAGTITIVDATINMKENSAISVISSGAGAGGTFTLNKGEINLGGLDFNKDYSSAVTSATVAATKNRAALIYGDSGSTLNFSGGTVNVEEGKVGEIRGRTINLKGSSFEIKDNGALLIGADAPSATPLATATLNGSTITNNGGELWFGNAAPLTVTNAGSGSVIQVDAISGTIENTDGITHIASGATVNLNGAELNNAGVLDIQSGGTVNVLEQENTSKGTDGIVTLGGTINIAGALNVGSASPVSNGSTLIIDEDATLTTSKEAVSPSGAITVYSGNTIELNASQLAAFLDEGDLVDIDGNPDNAPTGDKKGAFVLSGGTVDFRDAVTLSDFDFSANAGTAEAGKIDVISGTAAVAKATTVTLEKALSGASAANLAIEANNLKVNITDKSDSDTINIDGKLNFKEATVKSDLSFAAAGADFLKVGNTYYLEAATPNTNATTGKVSYTAAEGTITGKDIELVGTSSSLNINAGNWTAAQEIILNGGSINVNVADANGNEHNFGTDSTLTLTKGLTFDLNGSSKVTVSNTSTQTVDRPTAALDLTAGLKIKKDTENGAGTNSITVSGNGAKLTLNAADTNALLSDDSSLNKLSVDVANGGALNVAGAVSANFNDLVATGATATAGKLNFTNNGEFKVDSLTLTGDSSNPKNGSTTNLNIGNGVISTNELRLIDSRSPMTDPKTGDDLTKIVVDGGKLQIAQTLYSNAYDLQLNGNSALRLATNEEGAQGRIETLDRITLGTAKGTNSAEINVAAGKWLATETDIVINAGTLSVGGDTQNAASFQSRDLSVGTNGVISIKDNGSAIFETLDAALAKNDSIKIENGNLTITGRAGDMDNDADKNENHHGLYFGDSTSKNVNNYDSVFTVAGNNANLTFGQEATLTFFDATKKGGNDNGSDDDTTTDGDASSNSTSIVVDDSVKGKLLVREGGTVTMDFDGHSFTLDQVQSLKKQLFHGNFNYTNWHLDGFFNIGDAKITDLNIVDGKIAWSELENISDIVYDTYNNELSQATVTGVTTNDRLGGNYGAIQTTNNTAQVSLDSNLTLNNAANNSGNFVGTADGTPVDVLVNTGLNFIANGSGTLANVTLNQADARENDPATFIANATNAENTITIADVNASGSNSANTLFTTSGAGTVKVNNIDVGAVQFVGTTNEVAGSLQANNMDFVNTKLTAQDITLRGNNFNADNSQITINGDLRLNDNDNSFMAVQHGATVSVLGNFTAATDADIRIGSADITENKYNDLVAAYGEAAISKYVDKYRNLKTNTSSSGVFEVRGEARLNGTTVFADPNYGSRASVISFNYFKDADTTNNRLGSLDGDLVAGKNSIIGVGFANAAALTETIAKLQYNSSTLVDAETGSLDQNKIGSILYVNGQLNVAKGNKIALNSNVNYDTVEQIEADIRRQLANLPELPTIPDDDDTTGDNTSSGDTVTQAEENIDTPIPSNTIPNLTLGSNTALIIADKAFDAASKDVNGKSAAIKFEDSHAEVYAQAGAKVLVDGTNFSLDSVDIFDDAEGDGVKLSTSDRKGLVIESLNGWFTYTLADGDSVGTDVQLSFTEPVEQALELSDPVYQSIVALDTGINEGRYQTKQGTFLNTALAESKTGREIEQVARLGVYAGTAQAALTAVHSTTEALYSRAGIGANSSTLTMADNAQGATLWLTPVYKSSDSDGFGAQGVDYGTNLDLYGVALGADYTLSNGIHLGAAFNIGSGDADGEGIADGISNEFDYYGFSVYGGLTNGPLSLIADISYTTVDNEFDTTANFTTASYKLAGTADSTALSIGVTAQYEINLGSVTVAPHGGLRYTNLELDDYDIKAGDSTVAHYESDSLSFISIPVGVTISSEIINGSWTIKPAADLTLTANLGDDELEGNTTWADTDSGYGALKTNLTTEVLDGFTYGVSAGVSAQSGNFSLGVGVNYTGSSNTDEFGVNANARFVF